MGALQNNGATHRSTPGGITVKVDGEELLSARLEDGLYHLDIVTKENESYLAVGNSLRLWHRRFGHLHYDAIRSMVSKGLVKGLSATNLRDYDRVCEGCVLGKSHCLPFPKVSETKHELMDLLTVDLTGPMAVTTWSGMAYALIVVEAASRYITCQLLKSNEEVADVLKEVIALLEHQSGRKVKKICTDNGTEFINSTIENLCKRNGILHETTAPYTAMPQAVPNV